MQDSLAHRVKRTSIKIFRIIIISLIVIGIGVFCFYYWGVYDRGVMAGKVLRISKKGVVFKTYEGKINLETFGALKGTSPIAESFDFSVEGDEDALIKKLEEVSLSGERINLHFVKRYAIFPWRGDTKYFATAVEQAQDVKAE
jgi:hypothetical protein